MREPALQAKFRANRMTPVVATQAETEAMLKAFREQWLPVVRKSGFQP
jgi:tripartite-type tricarboxylate transporter receptor subunit TctC